MQTFIACEFGAILILLFLINFRLDCISRLINILLEKDNEHKN